MTDPLTDSFERSRGSVLRVETLPSYGVPGETHELRSLRGNRYLARVARAALAGRPWERLRVVDDPLTDYQRDQLCRVFVASVACGEDVYVVPRTRVVPDLGDWWHFDRGLSTERAVRLHFAADGSPLPERDELVTDPDRLDELAADAASLFEVAQPLQRFLDGLR